MVEKDFSKIAVRPLKSSRLKRRAGKKKERKKRLQMITVDAASHSRPLRNAKIYRLRLRLCWWILNIPNRKVGSKGWLAIAKLKPHSLFISLLLMVQKAFDNVEIEK